jgi:superfamily I DNA and/or RNA helicase
MEAFQGLESGVVILCTTRSKQRFVSKDKELDWGIVGMPNKMNVALTRAKFGLIVIGKKSVLAQDPNWNAWLQFCDRNGLLSGETDGIRIVRHGKLTMLMTE